MKQVIFAIVLFSSVSAFMLQNSAIQPTSQLQYVSLLKGILAVNSLSDTMSSELKNFFANARPSLLNAPSKIRLVLCPSNNSQSFFRASGQHLQTIFSSYSHLFSVAWDKDPLPENKKQHQQIIHQIVGTESQLTTLYSILKFNQPRLLQNVPTPPKVKQSLSDSYILKFFFVFVFIGVIIGALSLIISMDNSKDTLLYAKFIAEVPK